MSSELPTLARREREKRPEPAPVAIERVPVVERQKADPVIVQVPNRARVVFMEVIRDEFGEIAGIRPVYEDE